MANGSAVIADAVVDDAAAVGDVAADGAAGSDAVGLKLVVN